MASRTAKCNWCGASFTGYGETGNEAQRDADSQAAYHAFNQCPSNPANQSDEDDD